MSIGCCINDDSFKLYGKTVQYVNTVRDLGVQFCSNLTLRRILIKSLLIHMPEQI